MSIFRQKADRLPISLFVLYFCLDLIVFFQITDHWFIVGWFVIGIYLKGTICAWNHHHQHVATFRSSFLNRFLEIIYGFQTGATSRAWTLHHVLGHHLNYLDQSQDESAWMTKSGRKMGTLEYIAVVTSTIFFRVIKVGKKYPHQLKNYFSMLLIQLIILGAFFALNWFNALFIFALPMIVGLTVTVWATYDHHSGLDTKDEFSGSRNITDDFYNLMTGNLGYHTAHHVRQGIHWSKLPEYHQTIAHKIPNQCFIEPGMPYSWIKSARKNISAVLIRKQGSAQ